MPRSCTARSTTTRRSAPARGASRARPWPSTTRGAISADGDLEPIVLSSRPSSWTRKSSRRPIAAPSRRDQRRASCSRWQPSRTSSSVTSARSASSATSWASRAGSTVDASPSPSSRSDPLAQPALARRRGALGERRERADQRAQRRPRARRARARAPCPRSSRIAISAVERAVVRRGGRGGEQLAVVALGVGVGDDHDARLRDGRARARAAAVPSSLRERGAARRDAARAASRSIAHARPRSRRSIRTATVTAPRSIRSRSRATIASSIPGSSEVPRSLTSRKRWFTDRISIVDPAPAALGGAAAVPGHAAHRRLIPRGSDVVTVDVDGDGDGDDQGEIVAVAVDVNVNVRIRSPPCAASSSCSPSSRAARPHPRRRRRASACSTRSARPRPRRSAR